MSQKPLQNLSDEDIKRLAREAETENYRLDPGERKPRGWHYRRAAIRLRLMPLADMTVDEVVWELTEAVRRVTG